MHLGAFRLVVQILVFVICYVDLTGGEERVSRYIWSGRCYWEERVSRYIWSGPSQFGSVRVSSWFQIAFSVARGRMSPGFRVVYFKCNWVYFGLRVWYISLPRHSHHLCDKLADQSSSLAFCCC